MKKWIWVLLWASSTQAQHRLLVSGCGYGEVAVYAADGSCEWKMSEANEVSDAWLLPNGDVAMAYKHGARVVRPDWTNRRGFTVVMERFANKECEIHTCMPLPEGGFLIGESFAGLSAILELDEHFVERKRIELKGLGGKHSTFRQIRKTPEGTYLITQQQKGGIAMEVDGNGKIIRRFPDGRFVAERLPNGNTLIACGDAHRILEIAPDGAEVWKLEQNELEGVQIGFAAGVQRLPNGNTLFCNWGGHGQTSGGSVLEVSPEKDVVWFTSPGTAHRISNVKVLPGALSTPPGGQ